MPTLDRQFDAIIADLPYGTTACKWDSVIPFGPLWEQYKRLIKPRGAVVLFGSQPFTSALVMSNLEWFKYCWYWCKSLKTNFLNAKIQPLRQVSEIMIFYEAQPTYNPQGIVPGKITGGNKGTPTLSEWDSTSYEQEMTGYPSDLLEMPHSNHNGLHPTQKPVALLEYLIKTYTNPGEWVLDNVMGSGSTGVACVNTGRHFAGIELLPEYFEIAQERIEQAQAKMVQLELAQ